MMEALLEMTALPNLHPALVHFPIALAAVALLFDAAVFVERRWPVVDRITAALWVLAAASAGATYLAGQQAANGLDMLSASAEAALAAHADLALAALIAIGALALLRTGIAWRDRSEPMIRRDALRAVALLAALGLQGLVVRTADLGGALVYRHAVAVEPAWVSVPPGEAAPAQTVEPLAATAASVPLAGDAGNGLTLTVSGRTLLGRPGTWEDAQLEVRLDTSGFTGVVGLSARDDGHSTAGLFRVGTDGSLSLLARRDGREQMLDQGEIEPPSGEWTLSLSAVGQHWKGFVNGRSVAHGHVQIPTPGRGALLLDGTGTVRIVSLRISPASPVGTHHEGH